MSMSDAQLILLEYAEPLVMLVEAAEAVSLTATNREDGTITLDHDTFRRFQNAVEATTQMLDLIAPKQVPHD